jgi:hypothetical protein
VVDSGAKNRYLLGWYQIHMHAHGSCGSGSSRVFKFIFYFLGVVFCIVFVGWFVVSLF